MKRPDVEKILSPLKAFQRRTVDHAYHRLFNAEDSTARFLVADEVGLGKTLVARGVIARAVHDMWDDVGRIDVIYICSNGSIAAQNLRKLQIMGRQADELPLATRLTLLATQLGHKGRDGLTFEERKVNFVSFTPGTSFNLRSTTGVAEERVVLYQLVRDHHRGNVRVMNLFQAGVQDPVRWRAWCKSPQPIASSVKRAFAAAYGDKTCAALRDEFDKALTWFTRFPFRTGTWSDEACSRRNRVIGKLRQLLAMICIQELEPDLVILDEFQRFKRLLDPVGGEGADPARELAQALFHAETPEGNPVRILALSATPYKLYATDAEIGEEDHYPDFIATTRFLMGGEHARERVQAFEDKLHGYRLALSAAARGDDSRIVGARRAVETELRSVMARTERVIQTADRQAMVVQKDSRPPVKPADVRQYVAHAALFSAIKAGDPMNYWKAAPYLLNFMSGYKFNRRLDADLETGGAATRPVLKHHAADWLRESSLVRYRRLKPAQPKLREFADDMLGAGQWQLLWVPPTVPYWPLGGVFQGHEHFTKRLVFSAWNVVPEVIAGVISYEAERLSLGPTAGNYRKPARHQRLRLAVDPLGRPSALRSLNLLYPGLWLADVAHPLRGAAAGEDARAYVRDRIRERLATLPPRQGEVDERWEWAAPALLDLAQTALSFLNKWQLRMDGDDGEDEGPRHFPLYVTQLRELIQHPESLGPRPDGLEDLLVEAALGAPGVLACRSLAPFGLSDVERMHLAGWVASDFWSLFNRPAASATVRNAHPDGAYWRAVLRYAQDGNLQSLLDEQLHMIREGLTWDADKTNYEIADQTVDMLGETVRPKTSRILAQFYRPGRNDTVTRSELRIRAGFALRFGQARDADENRRASQDAVRDAFNSPFRPFVLASTSVGQEGLDFHPWCHAITHWNLPGNPVDLEQREGRVHRYKGHAVRRNVALATVVEALRTWCPGADLWQLMFGLATHPNQPELEPYWLMPGPFKVRRHVPLLPYTREIERFARLRRQLAAYRVVFGQPRQEELLDLIATSDASIEDLQSWVMDLRPPTVSGE